MPSMPDHGRARGVIVRAIRIAQRRDQRDVAEASNIEAPYLSLIETERRRPSPEYTERLAAGLRVDVAILCGQLPVLATLREAAGMSRQKLADAIAMKPSRLEHLERGLGLPTAEEAARLARRLGADPRVFDTLAAVDQAS
jgi:transcriptional regulator with XRE-family HTH domain